MDTYGFEIMSWSYWGADKSEVIRNLGLIVIATVGSPFLIWRAFSAHNTSLASLEQAKASLKQSETALKQADIAMQQAKDNTRQTDHVIQRQFADHLIRAFDQLGSENVSVRLGGILTLERLAKDSFDNHHPIMEALAAFVRANIALEGKKVSELPEIAQQILKSEVFQGTIREIQDSAPSYQLGWDPARIDIQAIFNVLGRREQSHEPFGKYLNFRETDLAGIQLSGLNFAGCSFMWANLQGAKLVSTNLTRANLFGADLTGAILLKANLNKAKLSGAVLRGAMLNEAAFRDADLRGAVLEKAMLGHSDLAGADLCYADLRGATDLSEEQLELAQGDTDTMLPAGVRAPTHWGRSD